VPEQRLVERVGFGMSFSDTGAGEQSRGLSSIAAGRAGRRPWFTFRKSRDRVEAEKLEDRCVIVRALGPTVVSAAIVHVCVLLSTFSSVYVVMVLLWGF